MPDFIISLFVLALLYYYFEYSLPRGQLRPVNKLLDLREQVRWKRTSLENFQREGLSQDFTDQQQARERAEEHLKEDLAFAYRELRQFLGYKEEK